MSILLSIAMAAAYVFFAVIFAVLLFNDDNPNKKQEVLSCCLVGTLWPLCCAARIFVKLIQ